MKTQQKGQAALEFLMTYAWAFVAMLIIIAAFVYFGILNPRQLLPDRCNFAAEIGCKDMMLGSNGMQLMLQNNVGESIVIDDLNVKIGETQLSCASLVVGTTWASGETLNVPVVCDFSGTGFVEGNKAKLDLKLKYYSTKAGSAFSREVYGEVLAVVGSGTIAGGESVTLGISCKDVLDNGYSSGDGIYTIDPDGDGEEAPFQVYCDMNIYFILNNQPNQDGNLLDSSTWVVGSSGSQPGFNQNGQTSENVIELGIGPYGEEVVLWRGGNDAESNADGGWRTATFTVDPAKAYRYTVWFKRLYSTGTTYLGLQSSVGRLDGGTQSNPYFWCSDPPEYNKWYLIAGYILPSDTSITTGGIGGVYDGETKEKVRSFTSTTGNCNSDYKHLPGDTTQNHRAYLFYDTNVNNRQWFYDPRVEVKEFLS